MKLKAKLLFRFYRFLGFTQAGLMFNAQDELKQACPQCGPDKGFNAKIPYTTEIKFLIGRCPSCGQWLFYRQCNTGDFSK